MSTPDTRAAAHGSATILTGVPQQKHMHMSCSKAYRSGTKLPRFVFFLLSNTNSERELSNSAVRVFLENGNCWHVQNVHLERFMKMIDAEQHLGERARERKREREREIANSTRYPPKPRKPEARESDLVLVNEKEKWRPLDHNGVVC